MTIRTGTSVCMLCEAICGLEVEHDGEQVLRVRGDARDPFSRGHICPKGVALADVQNDPDRLRRPLRRRGDRWQEVPWDEALDEAAERLHAVQARHGRDALAVYTGNPTGHSYSATLSLGLLLEQIGTRNAYSAASVDALPRVWVSAQLYGNQGVIPVPDLDRTDFLLMLGANPVVSNGSVMTAPDVAGRLRALRKRGGRLVVVDPRRTETAKLADTHFFVRPGSDALLLASLLQVLFAEGRVDLGRLAPLVEGWDRIEPLVAPFSPERVAPRVGIGAAEITQLARDFAAAPSAVAYGRMGVCTQEFGGLASWLIDLLNIATGNLDRPGGAMFTTPAVDLPSVAERIGQIGEFDRWRSRVSGLPEYNGELPVAVFAEEMETPGPGQIRALLLHAGNPVLSLPNGRRIERALANLDFVVAIDIYRNETTRHADLILPPTFGLERDQYPLLGHGLSVRNTAHYTPAVLPKPAGSLDDWEIVVSLAERLGRRQGGRARLGAWLRGRLFRAVGPRGLLALALRLGPQPVTLRQLERAPHGIDLGPLEPRLPGILRGPRIRVAPERLIRDWPRLERRLAEPAAADGPLRLIGRRTLRSNNSWMHNSERLVSGRDRCVLLMHPDDASRRDLRSGQAVVLKSKVGEVEVPLEVSDEVAPGVVSLPHGWGHARPGNGLAVARAHPGASMNDVVDDALIDPALGTSSLNGIPVEVHAGLS